MKSKQLTLFAVAIGCGLVAMIGAQQILSGNKLPEQEMVKILVAKVEIDPGIPLDKSNVAFKDWPKENVPDGAILTEEEFAEHALKIRISPNMPVLKPYLGAKGLVGITSQIPKGMNMVTLPVDATMTHSGLLRPGSFVTVTGVFSRPSREGREFAPTVKTVLKRVKVIAVGDKVAGTEATTKDPNGGKVENVSFVVFPRQANLLNLAKEISKGRLQLQLLGEEDKSTEDTQDLDENAFAQKSSELFGERERERERPKEVLESPKSVPNNVTATTPVRPSGSSFAEYLSQKPVAPEIADLGKRPTRATWRIEIYNGDRKDIHEMELPDETATAPAKPPTTNDQWAAPLMQFFSRKREKSGVEETQTNPSDEMQSESSNNKSASKPTDTVRQ